MAIMLFVLGLFFIAVGIGLSTVTQTVTRYFLSYYGIQVPYQATVYPYQGIGVLMALFGIIILIVAFVKTRSKKTESKEMPKTERARATQPTNQHTFDG